jgi:anti-sigma28 factor (negative regulator of flagellin synthesis)
MKIEGNRPNVDATLTSKVEATKVGAGSQDQAGRLSKDEVTVSPEVRLANEAVATVNRDLGIRPEAVERGKALLASGKLGSDPLALADKLIERTLEEM